MISKIVGLFVNTLSADDKYSLFNTEKIMQPIQMQLSKKQKKIFSFFLTFLKPTSNL